MKYLDKTVLLKIIFKKSYLCLGIKRDNLWAQEEQTKKTYANK